MINFGKRTSFDKLSSKEKELIDFLRLSIEHCKKLVDCEQDEHYKHKIWAYQDVVRAIVYPKFRKKFIGDLQNIYKLPPLEDFF